MSLSTDGIKWSDWKDFDDEVKYELTEGDGGKRVFLKVRDEVGNIAEPVYDSIILDTTPPRNLTILINNGSAFTEFRDVVLRLGAVDDTTEVDAMSVSNGGQNWGEWQTFGNLYYHKLSEGEGNINVYFRVRDSAGNVADSVSASILFDPNGTLRDTDSDGVLDVNDAFPNDPAASVDSDGDGYPDAWNIGKTKDDSTSEPKLTIDTFPNDPKKNSGSIIAEKPPLDSSSIIVLGIFALASIIVLILIMVIRKPKKSTITPYDDDKTLRELRDNVIYGKATGEKEPSYAELKTMYANNYLHENLTEETSEYIDNIIDESDRHTNENV
jgi:hypothetical protein